MVVVVGRVGGASVAREVASTSLARAHLSGSMNVAFTPAKNVRTRRSTRVACWSSAGTFWDRSV